MTMDQELKKAIKEDQREWRNTDRRVKGAEAVMKQDLQIANELAVHDYFTIPWACDFRGRFNMVPSFNYHRDDHIKSLFQFQRGRVVDGQNIRWLKIHIANCVGFEKIDKAPLDERVAWFDKNEGVLLDMAKDYKNSLGQWSGADKPFQMSSRNLSNMHVILRKVTTLLASFLSHLMGLIVASSTTQCLP